MGHAGDLSCKECWERLAGDPRAQLVDVRTSAEWNFVGVPELRSLGRETLLIEWQAYPSMAVNAAFADTLSRRLEALGADRDTPVMFICRSGARSASAAGVMTAAGWRQAYNVAGGFEGAKDANGHRGKLEGWKHDGLPWLQG